tara:strand:- start:307 stop:573 length:267 start_codon:yes stop_codon:yes gene_type:complete
MATWESYTVDRETFTQLANQAKEVLVHGLVNEGYLTDEQSEEILSSYALVVHKPGIIGSFIKKYLWPDEGKSDIMTLFKLVTKIEKES